MKSPYLIALAVLVLLSFGGCQPELHGDCTVVDKSHTDAFTTYVTVSTGKSFMMVPQYHPASWRIQLQEDVAPVSDGEPRTAWYDIPDSLYDGVRMGDRVSVRRADELQNIARGGK